MSSSSSVVEKPDTLKTYLVQSPSLPPQTTTSFPQVSPVHKWCSSVFDSWLNADKAGFFGLRNTHIRDDSGNEMKDKVILENQQQNESPEFYTIFPLEIRLNIFSRDPKIEHVTLSCGQKYDFGKFRHEVLVYFHASSAGILQRNTIVEIRDFNIFDQQFMFMPVGSQFTFTSKNVCSKLTILEIIPIAGIGRLLTKSPENIPPFRLGWVIERVQMYRSYLKKGMIDLQFFHRVTGQINRYVGAKFVEMTAYMNSWPSTGPQQTPLSPNAAALMVSEPVAGKNKRTGPHHGDVVQPINAESASPADVNPTNTENQQKRFKSTALPNEIGVLPESQTLVNPEALPATSSLALKNADEESLNRLPPVEYSGFALMAINSESLASASFSIAPNHMQTFRNTCKYAFYFLCETHLKHLEQLTAPAALTETLQQHIRSFRGVCPQCHIVHLTSTGFGILGPAYDFLKLSDLCHYWIPTRDSFSSPRFGYFIRGGIFRITIQVQHLDAFLSQFNFLRRENTKRCAEFENFLLVRLLKLNSDVSSQPLTKRGLNVSFYPGSTEYDTTEVKK